MGQGNADRMRRVLLLLLVLVVAGDGAEDDACVLDLEQRIISSNRCSCRIVNSSYSVVDCSGLFLFALPPGLPNTTAELRLRNNLFDEIPTELFGEGFPMLNTLDIGENRVKIIAVTIIPLIQNLRSLEMDGNLLECTLGPFSCSCSRMQDTMGFSAASLFCVPDVDASASTSPPLSTTPPQRLDNGRDQATAGIPSTTTTPTPLVTNGSDFDDPNATTVTTVSSSPTTTSFRTTDSKSRIDQDTEGDIYNGRARGETTTTGVPSSAPIPTSQSAPLVLAYALGALVVILLLLLLVMAWRVRKSGHPSNVMPSSSFPMQENPIAGFAAVEESPVDYADLDGEYRAYQPSDSSAPGYTKLKGSYTSYAPGQQRGAYYSTIKDDVTVTTKDEQMYETPVPVGRPIVAEPCPVDDVDRRVTLRKEDFAEYQAMLAKEEAGIETKLSAAVGAGAPSDWTPRVVQLDDYGSAATEDAEYQEITAIGQAFSRAHTPAISNLTYDPHLSEQGV